MPDGHDQQATPAAKVPSKKGGRNVEFDQVFIDESPYLFDSFDGEEFFVSHFGTLLSGLVVPCFWRLFFELARRILHPPVCVGKSKSVRKAKEFSVLSIHPLLVEIMGAGF